MKKILYTLTALLAVGSTAFAQYSVKHMNGVNEAPAASVSFCLPQNSFRIEVEVEKTVQERGVYADHAEQLLKLPAIKQDAVRYRITGLRLHTLALPDPTQVYAIEGSEIPDLQLLPDGIILGVNRDAETAAECKHGVKRGRDGFGHDGFGTPDGPGFGSTEKAPQARKRQGEHRHQPVAMPGSGAGYDTLTVTHVIDSVTVIEKILKPRVASKELYEQARKAADQIRELQKTQANLLSGLQEVPYPEGTFKFMVEELKDKERNLMECFTGTTRTEVLRMEFLVEPERGKTEYALAVFNENEGLTETEDENAFAAGVLTLSLTPMTLPALQTTSDPKNYKEPDPDPKAAKKGPVKPADRGFAYRIPAKVQASISLNGETLESRPMFIAQWGSLQQLPALSGYTIEFDSKTGSLKSLHKQTR